MDSEVDALPVLFPHIAVQLRGVLSNMRLAASQLAPAAAREQDPELDARAAVLDQSYYQLLRMVSNLTAAGLYSRKSWPQQDWDLVELVEDLCRQSASLAELAGLKLRFLCSMSQHVCAANRPGLEELLLQLLSNAMKFTPAGGEVTVELRRAGGRVLLSVGDTGCGIQEDRLPTLFDHDFHGEMDLQPRGMGLGLPLCRRIAEGLGGAIVAESRPGEGARFTLSIPDRKSGSTGVSDVNMDYSGGFNRTLLALADAMPAGAFLIRNQ